MRQASTIVVAFIAIVGLSCEQKTPSMAIQAPTPEVVAPKPTKTAVPPKPPETKAFSYTADEFAKDADKEWRVMFKQFGRRPIKVAGVIKGINTNIAHAAFIELKVSNSANGVICYTADKKPWLTYRPGQQVTLEGYYPPEFGFGHTLQKAKVTEAGPLPNEVLQASTLAQESAADAEGMHRKYKGKYLVVQGKVAAFEIDQFATATLLLQGPKQPALKVMLPQYELFNGKALAPGEEVLLLVDCNFIRPEIIYFSGGRVLRP